MDERKLSTAISFITEITDFPASNQRSNQFGNISSLLKYEREGINTGVGVWKKKKKKNSPSATDTSPWDGKKEVISIKQFLGRSSKQVTICFMWSFKKHIK